MFNQYSIQTENGLEVFTSSGMKNTSRGALFLARFEVNDKQLYKKQHNFRDAKDSLQFTSQF